MEAPLALYRRYRPDTYADVIGQDHVTEPLRQALRNNRVNHAYLFSGPRGCGKTTSARILARCLNCAQGPTPEPCGECQSCQDLARGGPGSIDVIEIDAASHGGVDDARDLRERAFFAPVSAHYKIYIVDEAHMVTTQGFNALLKLVEEPPEHLKFIFATTEPDKVIGTIRSRTHHYPFRLVPPKLLQDYLAKICSDEGVQVDPGALPLVVRAGGGSVRDTLSVLDQLLGGATGEGVTYEHAVALLGYTPDSLLDQVVEALATRDGGAVFSVVDKVIESGQDPKRFGEDLLRRLRDLVVVSAVPDAGARGLIEGSPDLLSRLGEQAARFGAAELTRAADVVHGGLTDMRGATAPRLQLELICARVLLPSADDSDQGVHARLERLERAMSDGSPVAATPRSAPARSAPSAAQQPAPATAQPEQAPPAPAQAPPRPAQAPAPPAAAPAPPAAAQVPSVPTSAQGSAPAVPPAATTGTVAPSAASPSPGSPGLAEVRGRWEQILEAVARKRRFTWILLSQNAHIAGVSGNTITVGLVNAGARDSFARGGSDEILKQALQEVLGGDWRVEAVVDPGGGSGPRPVAAEPSPSGPPSSSSPLGSPLPSGSPPPQAPAGPPRPAGSSPPQAPAGRSTASTPPSPDRSRSTEDAAGAPTASERPSPVRSSEAAREGGGRGRARQAAEPDDWRPASVTSAGQVPGNPDDEVDPETDTALPENPTTQTELLEREFGAQIIEEVPNR